MDLTFLPDLVAEVLGASSRVIAYQPILHSPDYCVVIGELAPSGAKISLKLAGPNAPHWASADAFDRAKVLSHLVRHQGVTAPEVLAVDTSCTRWPVRYLIATFLPGTTWASTAHRFNDADRSIVFAELGSAVARMHALDFDAFGNLDPSGTVREGSAYVDALARRAAARIASPAHIALFESLIERHRGLLDEVARPRLTHEDLNPNNLLVSNTGRSWHLAGLLDFDSAWAGNAESDLARLELWRGMMHPSFWHTYAAAHRLSELYASRRAMLQLLWCLEYAKPTAQHNADTAAVCAELEIPAIVFV